MNDNYLTKDMLLAIDTLLGNKEEKTLKLVDQIEEPLILKKEANSLKDSRENIPKNTEKIILQAEKYLKK